MILSEIKKAAKYNLKPRNEEEISVVLDKILVDFKSRKLTRKKAKSLIGEMSYNLYLYLK